MVDGRSRVTALRPAWRTAHLSARFVLDVTRISRAGGDALEPLLLTAILQANQAAMLADPELQLRYAAAAALPDPLRRPISINALAQSLGLPFETVRRRVRALQGRGLCVARENGVYVPEAVVGSTAYRQVQAARAERLAVFHRELGAAGLGFGATGLEAFVGASPRAADRLLADYMLRICGDLIALTGGVLDGLLLVGLFACTFAEAAPAAEAAAALAPARPIFGLGLARAVGLPAETVRRRLGGLEQAGFCRRAGRGWLAAAPSDRRPAVERLVTENVRNLRRLFASLGGLAARGRDEDRAAG